MKFKYTRSVCGVDEAGRGPLAGPVYAAAVILDPKIPIRGIADSKLLTAGKREEVAIQIKRRAVAWSVAFATVEEIDTINILRASLLAMSRAVAGLSVQPEEAIVDGNMKPTLMIACSTLVDGDRLHRSIGAASILAKTARDAVLIELDALYPHYGFAQHKGYATPQHLEALRLHGPCAIHRKSFSPCSPQQALDLEQDLRIF